MNLQVSKKPVHVFLEQAVERGPGSSRELLTGAESCLEYYEIRLVERFWCRSRATLVYHFVAPDAESVRHVARRNSDGIETLWLAASEESDQAASESSQPVYAAIYDRRVNNETEVRQHVFVAEDGGRLLAFCALAESAAEADEVHAVRPERPGPDSLSQYDIWRDCG